MKVEFPNLLGVFEYKGNFKYQDCRAWAVILTEWECFLSSL